MKFTKEEFERILYVPLSVIVASFIIVIITTGVSDPNTVSALIGGYMGLFLGVTIVTVLTSMNIPFTNWLDLIPFVVLLIIIFLMIYYLYQYFNRISTGQVSTYYSSFSTLSTLFIATQLIILFSSLYKISDNFQNKILTSKTFSLVSLFSVINLLVVITLGIILRFYSTQG